MKQRLLSLLLNQYIIAILITMFILYFLPDYFSKYKVEMVSKELSGELNNLFYYEDLNGDGMSEKIISQFQAPNNNASFLLFKSNGDLINQYNFDKPFAGKIKYLWFQDANGNGLNEIFFITRSNDSLFLNSSEPFGDGKMHRENIFIDTVVAFNDEYNVSIDFCNTFSKIKSDKTDVVFTLQAGFSCYPRFAYKYYYNTSKIIKSDYLTNPTTISSLYNLDTDSKNEFLTISYSAANDSVSKFTSKSDYSTWLSVLDDDLNFMFKPIEFRAIGTFQTLPFINDSEIRLFSLFDSRQPETVPSKLMEISVDGQILNEILLQEDGPKSIYISNKDDIIIHNSLSGNILVFNSSLKQVASIQMDPEIRYFDYYDIDNDGFKEWIGFHLNTNYISIYRENFKHKISFQVSDVITSSSLNLGIKKISSQEWQIYFQKGQTNTLFSYHKNPLYVFRYAIYLGFYGLILLLVWLIIKGQKIREAKHRAIENEISELQIKAVKNQVDPHFVFNAINTISEMTLMENKLEADTYICKFSQFMRETLEQSDKITVTLKEELEYTENFIKLQQIRYNNKFDYVIQIDGQVTLNTKIPKHVLFTYVENAIKHGLSAKDKGMLKISAAKKLDTLMLSIEDNGDGFKKSKTPRKDSTGNGLLIMNKIFYLYSKLNNKNIKHRLTELKDAHHNNVGVKIDIEISN